MLQLMLMMLGCFGLGPRRAPADAHDAGVFRGWGLGVLQLMLMMLGCSGGWGLGVLQLMLMMLGCFGGGA